MVQSFSHFFLFTLHYLSNYIYSFLWVAPGRGRGGGRCEGRLDQIEELLFQLFAKFFF